jgi:methionyl-tRNA synthetase
MPESAERLWQTLDLPEEASQCWAEALNPITAGHRIVKPKPLFHKIEPDESTLEEKRAEMRKKMANTPK